MDVFVVRDVGVRAVRARVHVGAFCVACGVRGAELGRFERVVLFLQVLRHA